MPGREMYEILPELIDPNKAYPITGMQRFHVLKDIERGHYRGMMIVFYGNAGSGINRRDVGALRYICGTRKYVIIRLKEMEFKTWMDYRLYTFIPNQDYTFGVIGSPCDLTAEKLLWLATFVPKRKKLAILKKKRIYNAEHYFDPDIAQKRKSFKRAVDKRVSMALELFGKDKSG